jgi:hypothetical protein
MAQRKILKALHQQELGMEERVAIMLHIQINELIK